MTVMSHPRQEHAGVAPEVAAMTAAMLELAMILRRRRFARGALELNLPEIAIDLGERGRSPAHICAERREPPGDRGVHARGQRGGGDSYLTEQHAGFLRRVHPDPEPHKLDEFAEFARSLGLSLDLPQSRFELQRILARDGRQARRIRRPLRPAAEPEAGDLYARARRALRPGQRRLLPLHLADPPLSRPSGASPAYRPAGGQEARSQRRRAVRPGRALHAYRAPGRGGRARADPRSSCSLTWNHDRRDFHAIVVGRRGFRHLLPARGAARRGAGSRRPAWPTTITTWSRERTRWSAAARAGRIGLGDRIAVRVAHVDVDRRELDLFWPAQAGSRPAPRTAARSKDGDAPDGNHTSPRRRTSKNPPLQKGKGKSKQEKAGRKRKK